MLARVAAALVFLLLFAAYFYLRQPPAQPASQVREVVVEMAQSVSIRKQERLQYREPSRSLPSAHTFRAVFEVTAYTIADPGMDGRGITASGKMAQAWHTIAVDPALVPLGSQIYIPALADTPSGGWFVAEDTGGAIKGYKLDVCMPSRQEALQFGRRKLEAYVYVR